MTKYMNKIFSGIGIGLLLTLAVSCQGQQESSIRYPPVLSYDEFKSQSSIETFEGVPTGIYIVDGHTPVDGDERMQQLYDEYVSAYNQAFGISIVYSINGTDIVWSPTQKLQLTYCISSAFGARKAQVVQAMQDATLAWESAANINYTYLPAEDANCTAVNTNVMFNVEYTSGQIYMARSFWPNSIRPRRNVMIDEQSFTQFSVTLTAILRHELGHTLGLRHEHTRPEAGKCFEDNYWRPLTEYDSESVMHYPQCNGTGGWSLILTSKDILGIAALYGAPIN